VLDYLIGFGGGVCFTLVAIRLYIRGKLLERWYISGRVVDGEGKNDSGYEVLLKKGGESITIYRVLFDRKSSPNPDVRFEDQLTQARQDAEHRAEVLNINERRSREKNRDKGLPGGIA
jgi:hypothetical protein